jgi:site-specific DNA-methyltransferase (adenine-specific)
MTNTLYYGDNLDVLRRHVQDETVGLVYLDPPFKSDQNYNVLFQEQDGTRSAAQIRAFEDTWQWDQSAAAAYEGVVEEGGQVALALQGFRTVLGESDMLAYLSMMAPRLKELRRVLKPTGSIYLHCDPTASHYLKMLMDSVFGPDSFCNEIVWKRTNARSTQQRWPRIHDVLLFYAKTDAFFFRSLKTKADEAKLPHTLITAPDGLKYQTYELTAPGATKEGDSGKPWRGFDPTAMGRHWADSQVKMDEWNAQGLIHWPKPGSAGGFPRRRAAEPFDPESREITIADVWTDIDRINQAAKERLGYPTQKPEALLERIITANSNEGDTILDPFCGCGTAIAVAQKLNRRWIGIDVTHLAVTLMKHRLKTAFGEIEYRVIGEPTTVADAQTLAAEDPYQFQWWALGLVNARPVEQKKGADRGIDGRIFFHDERESAKTKQIIISVKAGKTRPPHVRDLRGVVDREKAAIGLLITMEAPTAPMRKEAASAGFYDCLAWNTKHPRLQILTVGELLEGKTIDAPATGDIRTFKKAPRAKPKSKDNQRGMF